ncbi:hypothetical protein BDZ89DRAFT_1166761 [Hymenopellis radicata]|nr:hypothetical protein BDZ89DRAFT_1166761 [Hymenopellis radicata]
MNSTTIHINDRDDFAILAPATPSQSIADAENDAIAFCSSGSSRQCDNIIPDGFITAAAVEYADDGSYVQITGCIDPSKFDMSPTDDGGQIGTQMVHNVPLEDMVLVLSNKPSARE